MTYIMKRLITAVLAATLCLTALCACGSQQSSAPSTGNEAPFNMDSSTLNTVLAGAWVNEADLRDKFRFNEDFSFIRYSGSDRHNGTAKLDEKSGFLTLTYEDKFEDEKSYVWVDSKSKLSANTWYVDGGTFSVGGKVYIRDYDL